MEGPRLQLQRGEGDIMQSNARLQRAVAFAAAMSTILIPIQPTWAQQNIGAAQVVVRDVQGTVGTAAPVPLRAGIDVFQNEVIVTGDDSASRVIFQDNTDLSIGAGSQVTLDRFVFDPDPSKSAVALSIAKGVIRFSTGGLPKSAYSITTPTATVGIRGTVLTVLVAANGATSVSVEEGAAIVTSAAGQAVTVNSGLSSSVAPGSPPTPPAPPSAPPPAVTQMNSMIAQASSPVGGAAGTSASASALGGISTGAILGAAAIAAIATGLAVGASGGSSSTPSAAVTTTTTTR
jgi:hypothetical protein